MEIITSREQFQRFATRQGVRYDWHESDEQDLTARVEGVTFDNAGFWPSNVAGYAAPELHVIFSRTEVDDNGEIGVIEDLAAVNLATLCSWATRS